MSSRRALTCSEGAFVDRVADVFVLRRLDTVASKLTCRFICLASCSQSTFVLYVAFSAVCASSMCFLLIRSLHAKCVQICCLVRLAALILWLEMNFDECMPEQ